MPSPINFTSKVTPELVSASRAAIKQFAEDILANETAIVSPNTGYKSYNKRMATAAEVIKDSNLYAKATAELILLNAPDVEQDAVGSSQPLASWLMSGNGSGTNVLGHTVAVNSGYNNSGNPTNASQMFDRIAGVNLADTL